MPQEKLSMKAFWDAVEQRLASCSADELRDILRSLAHETALADRQAFLRKLGSLPLQPVAAFQGALRKDDLLADIEQFLSDLKAAAQDADGEEEWEYERYGGYHDEDSLGPYATLVEPLAELFDRAEAAFGALCDLA